MNGGERHKITPIRKDCLGFFSSHPAKHPHSADGPPIIACSVADSIFQLATMKFLAEMMQLWMLALLGTTALIYRTTDAFSPLVPASLHRHPSASSSYYQHAPPPLLAEAKNASEISHENVEEYRDNLSIISRANGESPEVRWS